MTITQDNMDIEEMSNLEMRFKDAGIQVKPHYRSKAILCKAVSKDMACSPIKQNVNAGKNDTDKYNTYISDDTISNIPSINENTFKSTEEYFPSEEYTSEELKINKTESDDTTRKLKLSIIKRKSKMYIGIPEQFLYVIDLLHSKIGLVHTDILIFNTNQN